MLSPKLDAWRKQRIRPKDDLIKMDFFWFKRIKNKIKYKMMGIPSNGAIQLSLYLATISIFNIFNRVILIKTYSDALYQV